MFLEDKAQAETQVQEPSLQGFISWLETKPPTEKYNWWDGDRCACGQYAKHIGEPNWAYEANQGEGPSKSIWRQLNDLAYHAAYRVYSFGPREGTFCRLLEQARAA